MKSQKGRNTYNNTAPTRDREEVYKEKYFKEREKRKKCRERTTDPSDCKICSNEHRCPPEATEDYINAEKDRLSADNEKKSQKEAL